MEKINRIKTAIKSEQSLLLSATQKQIQKKIFTYTLILYAQAHNSSDPHLKRTRLYNMH